MPHFRAFDYRGTNLAYGTFFLLIDPFLECGSALLCRFCFCFVLLWSAAVLCDAAVVSGCFFAFASLKRATETKRETKKRNKSGRAKHCRTPKNAKPETDQICRKSAVTFGNTPVKHECCKNRQPKKGRSRAYQQQHDGVCHHDCFQPLSASQIRSMHFMRRKHENHAGVQCVAREAIVHPGKRVSRHQR